MRDVRDIPSQVFTITNFTEDLDMDCNTGTLGVVADTLATLIQELEKQGIIRATISA